MEPFPHHYDVTASATSEGHVSLRADDVPEIVSAPPAEFGGPGDKWSPESLLVAAVADCFVLSFRAIARASKLEWMDLRCDASGTLDRVERVTRFTGISVKATLVLPAVDDEAAAAATVEKAEKLLHKAEASCLITNSLIAESTLNTEITLAS
jgi:peroxiredoxin-like protein